MKDKYILGILGGVGPMAGIGLHKNIILHTKVKKDQKHFRVIHLSFSADINDRSDFLLSQNTIKNPGIQMADLVIKLSNFCKTLKTSCIIGVPCNTFHTEPIFNKFTDTIYKSIKIKNGKYGYIHILHMIDLTVMYLKQKNIKNIGVMSTTGTRNLKLYKNKLKKEKINLIEVSQKNQEILHNLIYCEKTGIKTLSYATLKIRNKFLEFIKILKKNGAEAIILGCTEIPIAIPEKNIFNLEMIDPVAIMSIEMIKLSNKNKLKIL